MPSMTGLIRRTTWVLGVAALLAALGGCASSPSAGGSAGGGYGPLSFNRAGADFYFFQDGRFARIEQAADGVLEIHLRSAPFQVGYNGRQMNVALALIPLEEVSTDPFGYKASRLSGPMSGGREPDSDVMLVYSGKVWSDGNTDLSDATTRKAAPQAGFQHAYQINALHFLEDQSLKLGSYRGTLHGYLVVYRQPKRRNQDIMPIRMMIDP